MRTAPGAACLLTVPPSLRWGRFRAHVTGEACGAPALSSQDPFLLRVLCGWPGLRRRPPLFCGESEGAAPPHGFPGDPASFSHRAGGTGSPCAPARSFLGAWRERAQEGAAQTSRCKWARRPRSRPGSDGPWARPADTECSPVSQAGKGTVPSFPPCSPCDACLLGLPTGRSRPQRSAPRREAQAAAAGAQTASDRGSRVTWGRRGQRWGSLGSRGDRERATGRAAPAAVGESGGTAARPRPKCVPLPGRSQVLCWA